MPKPQLLPPCPPPDASELPSAWPPMRRNTCPSAHRMDDRGRSKHANQRSARPIMAKYETAVPPPHFHPRRWSPTSWVRANSHANTRTHAHTHIRTQGNTHTRTHTNACAHTHALTHAARARAHKIRVHLHAPMHAYAQRYACARLSVAQHRQRRWLWRRQSRRRNATLRTVRPPKSSALRHPLRAANVPHDPKSRTSKSVARRPHASERWLHSGGRHRRVARARPLPTTQHFDAHSRLCHATPSPVTSKNPQTTGCPFRPI